MLRATTAGAFVFGLMACEASQAQAQAEAGLYAGLAVSQLRYAEVGAPTARPFGAMLRLGARFAPYLAAEVRLGTGIGGDTVMVGGTPVNLEVKALTANYLKGTVPVTRDFAPYVLVGSSWSRLKATSPSRSITDSTEAFSYGFGVDAAMAPHVRLNAEWARLNKAGESRLDALSIGASISF